MVNITAAVTNPQTEAVVGRCIQNFLCVGRDVDVDVTQCWHQHKMLRLLRTNNIVTVIITTCVGQNCHVQNWSKTVLVTQLTTD